MYILTFLRALAELRYLPSPLELAQSVLATFPNCMAAEAKSPVVLETWQIPLFLSSSPRLDNPRVPYFPTPIPSPAPRYPSGHQVFTPLIVLQVNELLK